MGDSTDRCVRLSREKKVTEEGYDFMTTEALNIRERMRLQAADRDLFEQAKAYAYDYMDHVCDRSVFPTGEAISRLDLFDEPLPEAPCDPGEILRLLHEHGSPATVAQTGGRYFGFVNGGAAPAALAAKWLADVWDQNCALYVISPVVSRLEALCERWLNDLLGLPSGTAAGFVSGTSTATMCGLATGRNELLRHMGWDVNAKGLFGAPKLRVVLGEQSHATVFKALALLGFGREGIEEVPADDQGRMDVAQMPALDGCTLVVAQAGNVNSGSGSRRFLTRGLEKADSWSVDAHKTLNAPYDCGIILCRHLACSASFLSRERIHKFVIYQSP